MGFSAAQQDELHMRCSIEQYKAPQQDRGSNLISSVQCVHYLDVHPSRGPFGSALMKQMGACVHMCAA